MGFAPRLLVVTLAKDSVLNVLTSRRDVATQMNRIVRRDGELISS